MHVYSTEQAGSRKPLAPILWVGLIVRRTYNAKISSANPVSLDCPIVNFLSHFGKEPQRRSTWPQNRKQMVYIDYRIAGNFRGCLLSRNPQRMHVYYQRRNRHFSCQHHARSLTQEAIIYSSAGA